MTLQPVLISIWGSFGDLSKMTQLTCGDGWWPHQGRRPHRQTTIPLFYTIRLFKGPQGIKFPLASPTEGKD